jgi:N-acetyl-alpha-D-muramate 1-phosphate uridylyltransferase
MNFMILAAGLGMRLRPLTLNTPKPLIPIAGQASCLSRLLEQLNRAGFNQGVINVSAHSQKMIAFIHGSTFSDRLFVSKEPENKPLGTAQGLRQGLSFLDNQPLLVISADIWTDFDFTTLLDLNPDYGHCILAPNPDKQKPGDFDLINGQLAPFQKHQYTYANIAVINPKLLKLAPKEKELGPILKHACAQNLLTGACYQGAWHNVGTLSILQHLRQSLCQPAHND